MNFLKSAFAVAIGLMVATHSTSLKADNFEFALGEWQPYIGKDLPEYGPHARKIAKAFAAEGHTVTFKFMKWNRAYELVKNGKVPASITWAKTPERAADVDFPAKPIDALVSRLYYSTKKHPNKGLAAETVDSLIEKGYRFVGVKGYWYEAMLKEKGAKLSIVSDSKSAWKTLNAGRADAFISNDNVANTEISDLFGGDALDMLVGTDTPVQIQDQFPIFANTPEGQKAKAIFEANIQ